MGIYTDYYKFYGTDIEIKDKEKFNELFFNFTHLKNDFDSINDVDFDCALTLEEDEYLLLMLGDYVEIIKYGCYVSCETDYFIGYRMKTIKEKYEKQLMGDDIFQKVDKEIKEVLKKFTMCKKQGKNKIQDLEVTI